MEEEGRGMMRGLDTWEGIISMREEREATYTLNGLQL